MCKFTKGKFVILILCLCILTTFFTVSAYADTDREFFEDYIPDRPPTGSVPMELWLNDEFANMYRLGASWYAWVDWGYTSTEHNWFKDVTATFTTDTIRIEGWDGNQVSSLTFRFSQAEMCWVAPGGIPIDHFLLYGNVSPIEWMATSYSAGYETGYYEGISYETFTFSELASAVIEAPVNVFMDFFQFEVLGVNFAQLAAVCVSLLAVAAVVLFFVRRMK